MSSVLISALVVRFLTRRFIGDYERNAGEKLSSITVCVCGLKRVYKIVVLKLILLPVCACAGNLYSREVQVDGEQVTIQVQDTPGVEVRSSFSPLQLSSDRKQISLFSVV